MAIKPRPTAAAPADKLDQFIAAAPDAAAAEKPAPAGLTGKKGKISMRGDKAQISLIIAPELLLAVDAAAEADRRSRNAMISILMEEALKQRQSR